MRDALSIFDQIVSFSGKSIKYEDVIRNLNILDYDYYFRITEACLGAEVGESLMIFNEILENGFDEHNFLVGLSSHMRDLLVCQDPVTLQLLEVGAGIRDKYQKQSQVTSQEWLYKALDILGVADISYKASRNQRLHVELALIKLCNISGVSKKKALTSDELPTEEKPVQPAGQQEPKTYPDSSPAQPRKKIPGTVPSIKDALNGVSRTGKEEGKDTGRTIRQVLSSAFTQDDLLEKWTDYADHIKEDKPRMSSSLKHHLPSLGDALQIEVIFSNSSQIEEFNRDIKHDLVSYLEDTLQNTQFRIIPVVQEVEGNENLLYTSEEKYDHMIKKNPNLGKLKERFNLDFE
jgi:DNA polymerase-3 subunit gamma/tau